MNCIQCGREGMYWDELKAHDCVAAAEIARLRDALKFYAASSHYPSKMDHDNGDLAREVLGLKIHWEYPENQRLSDRKGDEG